MNDHKDHGAGCKGQGIGKNGFHIDHEDCADDCRNGLHQAGCLTDEKAFSPGKAFPPQRKGNCGTLREILETDTKSNGDSSHQAFR